MLRNGFSWALHLLQVNLHAIFPTAQFTHLSQNFTSLLHTIFLAIDNLCTEYVPTMYQTVAFDASSYVRFPGFHTSSVMMLRDNSKTFHVKLSHSWALILIQWYYAGQDPTEQSTT